MVLLFIFECTFTFKLLVGGVAQLARAPALQAGGQEFDSPHLHHLIQKGIKEAHWKIHRYKEGKLAF